MSRDIKEIQLEGETLPANTNDLEKINQVGLQLYKNNRPRIEAEIPENWFAVIDPTSGKMIASLNPISLYHYTRENHSDRIFFMVGLLRNHLSQRTR